VGDAQYLSTTTPHLAYSVRRRYSVNAGEARKVAESFIATQKLRGHTATFVEAHPSTQWADSWTVNFNLHSPSGGAVDGGLMVIVNDVTREARFFDYSL
jgi:hypothetical protein